MNEKKSENFHEALICQYRDLLREAVFECESHHKTRLNIGKLNLKLQVICKAAEYDGLNETTLNQLINEIIPTHMEEMEEAA